MRAEAGRRGRATEKDDALLLQSREDKDSFCLRAFSVGKALSAAAGFFSMTTFQLLLDPRLGFKSEVVLPNRYKTRCRIGI